VNKRPDSGPSSSESVGVPAEEVKPQLTTSGAKPGPSLIYVLPKHDLRRRKRPQAEEAAADGAGLDLLLVVCPCRCGSRTSSANWATRVVRGTASSLRCPGAYHLTQLPATGCRRARLVGVDVDGCPDTIS
jgi:hypothetical protein